MSDFLHLYTMTSEARKHKSNQFIVLEITFLLQFSSIFCSRVNVVICVQRHKLKKIMADNDFSSGFRHFKNNKK